MIYDSHFASAIFLCFHLEFAVVELLVGYSNSSSNCGMNIHLVTPILQLFFLLLSFLASFSSAFHNTQVVGGIDDQIPKLPSSTGVEVVTYSKLLSQVIMCSSLSTILNILGGTLQ